jgi:AraC family transcriptional regulator
MKISKIAKENIARLNTAITFIEDNLSEKLSLEIVAEKAHFSPFHFHRLFKIIVGETVNNFINRKRIEKAAAYLLHQKEKNITEISEKVGFSNLSSFSKSFKKFYGISPNKFKEESPEKFSKICKTESKNGKVVITFELYICNINNALNWLKMRTNTEVKNIEKLELAYISHKGKMEAISSVYDKLVQWAAPKGLMNVETKMVTIYHDSPKITDPNNLRMSACIILNNPIKVDGEVNLKTIETTKCLVSRLEITPFEFQQAWESSFAFMIENGYKKSEIDPFEIYYNNAAEHPENKFIVDLCIPVL